MEFRINDLSMALPDTEWRDTSTYRLESKAPDGSPVVLEIYRNDPVSPERFAARVESDIAEHRRALRGFELVAKEEFRATEVDGISTSFRTVTAEGAVHHEVAYVPLPEVLLVFSVIGRLDQHAVCRELIVGAIDSIELRAGARSRRA